MSCWKLELPIGTVALAKSRSKEGIRSRRRGKNNQGSGFSNPGSMAKV